MPVGRPEDFADGQPMRAYRGKPAPLGRLTEWHCPSCGAKNTTPFEQGCGFCPVGRPLQAETVTPPSEAADWQLRPGIRPRPEDLAPKPGRIEYRPQPFHIPLETQASPLVVTRVIQYVCKPGKEDAMREGLRRSLVGTFNFEWGSITATIVDTIHPRQDDLLSVARLQPGVWMGHQEKESPTLPVVDYFEYHNTVRTPVPEPTPTPAPEQQIVPDTGPRYSLQEDALAKSILALGGFPLAYTLSRALDIFSGMGAEAQEPGKTLPVEGCASLANALLQQIPSEWINAQLEDQP